MANLNSRTEWNRNIEFPTVQLVTVTMNVTATITAVTTRAGHDAGAQCCAFTIESEAMVQRELLRATQDYRWPCYEGQFYT